MAQINVQITKPESYDRIKLIFRGFFVLIPMIILSFKMILASIYYSIGWLLILFTGKFPDSMWEFNKGCFVQAVKLYGFLYLISDDSDVSAE